MVRPFLIMAVKLLMENIYATYEDLFGKMIKFYFFFITEGISSKLPSEQYPNGILSSHLPLFSDVSASANETLSLVN
jgi:hypothetical protein